MAKLTERDDNQQDFGREDMEDQHDFIRTPLMIGQKSCEKRE
jgi:hypothetical protein